MTHAISALALTVQVAWEASEWTGRATAHYTAWTPCAAALPAIAFLWLVVRCRDSSRWPFPAHRRAYAVGAGGRSAALVTIWFFAVNVLSPGDASPLPYVPLGNPLDVTLALALGPPRRGRRTLPGCTQRALFRWLAVGLFVGAQWPHASHRASLGRCAVAPVVHAGVEAAAGGTDARVDAHRARRDGGGILATIAHRSGCWGRRCSQSSWRSSFSSTSARCLDCRE